MVLISFREWLHSYPEINNHARLHGGFVLISFREWLHSYLGVLALAFIFYYICSHLFQRVASFLQKQLRSNSRGPGVWFSSLSESGFIPTVLWFKNGTTWCSRVLISFREWLHSYLEPKKEGGNVAIPCSHLFQRVASFLLAIPSWAFRVFMSSSHLFQRVASFLQPAENTLFIVSTLVFSSLSESGFIPTFLNKLNKFFSRYKVLISFREWLHSYLQKKL